MLRNAILPLLIALMGLGLVACGDAQDKTIKELQDQLAKIDVANLKEMAKGATGDVKTKVTELMSQLESKKGLASEAIAKLKGAAATDMPGLLAKAKSSLGDVTQLVDKIKKLLGK